MQGPQQTPRDLYNPAEFIHHPTKPQAHLIGSQNPAAFPLAVKFKKEIRKTIVFAKASKRTGAVRVDG